MKKNTRDIKVLGIIPARGGSTSIKFKNIANVGGKPLIYYTIREAKKAKLLDAFIVSTDSPEIAAVAKKYGADVPFLRPTSTARKYSVEIEYQQHALKWLEKHRGWRPDLVVVLKPTSPLRTASLIDEVVEFIKKNRFYSMVVTVAPLSGGHPYRMWTHNKGTVKPILSGFVAAEHFEKWGYYVPRQKLPKVYAYNAAVDAIWAKNIKRGTKAVFAGPIGSIITDPSVSVDIDEPRDLKLAARLLKGKE